MRVIPSPPLIRTLEIANICTLRACCEQVCGTYEEKVEEKHSRAPYGKQQLAGAQLSVVPRSSVIRS